MDLSGELAAGNRLCQNCEKIPLDLFLPNHGCGHTFASGKYWLGQYLLSSFTDLGRFAAEGCVICRLCLDALKHDNVSDEPTVIERGQAASVTLVCRSEGEIKVFKHIDEVVIRTGSLNWHSQDMQLGRPRDRANSPRIFALAQTWLKTCDRDHRACQQSPTTFPTRLLYTGTRNKEANPPIYLVDTQSQHPGIEKYLALSHCWGTALGAFVPKTTKATLKSRQADIPWHDLTKTFQDAIEIARGLDIAYIWIDSLCIVQDDAEDFEIECARMREVYSNAYCTIAASDSPTSDLGCFIPRERDIVQGCTLSAKNTYNIVRSESLMDPNLGRERGPPSAKIQIYRSYLDFKDAIEGPLSTRGWTLQERELSRRILHYTADQVFWECRQCTVSEDSLIPIQKADQTDHLRSQEASYKFQSTATWQPKKLEVMNPASWRLLDEWSSLEGSDPDTTLSKWYSLAEAYSRRKLSIKNDKLPAISGIAAEVANLLRSGEYLAGVWKADFLRGISWFSDPVNRQPNKGIWPPPAMDEGIPSWSWASFNGSIVYHGESWFGKESAAVTANARLETARTKPCGRDPFGRVSGGEICLVGPAIMASVSESQYQPEFMGSGFQAKCYALSSSFKNPSTLRLYFDSDPEKLDRVEVVCLQLGNGVSVRGTQADVGLVLKRIESPGKVYRRIGMFDVEATDRKWRSLRSEQRLQIV